MSLENGELTIITYKKPVKPTKEERANWDEFDIQEFNMERKEYSGIKQKVIANLSTLYGKLWGQCDPIMHGKIKSHKHYNSAKEIRDVMKLLSIIDDICEGGNETKCYPLQSWMALSRLCSFRQGEDMSLAQYLDQFEVLITVAEKAGIEFVDEGMLRYALDRNEVVTDVDDNNAMATIKREAKAISIAMLFLKNSSSKFNAYMDNCHNNYNQGRDQYPLNISDMYTQMGEFKCRTPRSNQFPSSTKDKQHEYQFVIR